MKVEPLVASRRVLIIDQDAAVREVIQACLSDLAGWDVLAAGSAQEGLLKASDDRLDAIVLDPLTLEIDSRLFLQQLQQTSLPQPVPLVVLTARAYLVQAKRFEQFGIMGTIAKPFNPLTLHQQIAQALAWH